MPVQSNFHLFDMHILNECSFIHLYVMYGNEQLFWAPHYSKILGPEAKTSKKRLARLCFGSVLLLLRNTVLPRLVNPNFVGI